MMMARRFASSTEWTLAAIAVSRLGLIGAARDVTSLCSSAGGVLPESCEIKRSVCQNDAHAFLFGQAQIHVPDQIKERDSNQQHFFAITYTINAQSKEQVVSLTNALQAIKGVLLLI
jgi:hypothetical protein